MGEHIPQEPHVRPTGRRILVAEDNDVNLDMILDMLSIDGHHVTVARNGAQAIELAQSTKPEIILMDYRMPVMNGLEAVQRLRAMPEFQDLPIVALTASAGFEDERMCRDAGCTGYLKKPFTTKELLPALQLYLRPDVTPS